MALPGGMLQRYVNIVSGKMLVNELIQTNWRLKYVTGPGKIGLIYTKYTCLYYDTYLLFCLCYPHSVNFNEFLMDFCVYDNVLDMIQITDKKLF